MCTFAIKTHLFLLRFNPGAGSASLVNLIMTLSDFRHITDELLSAYIDDEVTEQERSLIETAIAQDEEIAWRLHSLRQTVSLLQELPELALPRSFALTLEQLQIAQPAQSTVQPVAEPQLAVPHTGSHSKPQVTEEAGFWARLQEDWRNFWQGGNHLLRNAAAVSFALMLVLTGVGQTLTRTMMQPAGMMATSSMPADAAPAAAEIALAPAATEVVVDSAASKAASSEEAADTAMARVAPETSAEEASAASVAAVQSSEAAVAEAASDGPANSVAMQSAPESDTSTNEAEATEPAVAAAMMAPAESAESTEAYAEPTAPLAAQPFPGGLGRGQAGGGDGVGGEGAPGDTSLVPPESYTFDVNPAGDVPPAEEAVVASAAVAAAPASEEAADEPVAEAAVADVSVTPAVDVVTESAAQEVATEEVTSEDATTEEADATSGPTPEAVALAAPPNITSSQVVENAPTAGAVSADSPASNLPVLWIAQGTTLLLTVMLASLWWRSRRPNQGSN